MRNVPIGITWNWELEYANGPSYKVDLYDVDLYSQKDRMAKLKAEGKNVICYFSAGSTEDFRLDNNQFPADVQGGVLNFGTGDTFSGEKWLDLRRVDKVLCAPPLLPEPCQTICCVVYSRVMHTS